MVGEGGGFSSFGFFRWCFRRVCVPVKVTGVGDDTDQGLRCEAVMAAMENGQVKFLLSWLRAEL